MPGTPQSVGAFASCSEPELTSLVCVWRGCVAWLCCAVYTAKLLNEDTVGFIMNDVHSDFRDLKGVTWRFLKWRYCSPTTYADTYCSLSLPKLLAPYVRLDLLNWLPLSRPDQTLDEFPFFTTLFSFHEPESEEMDAAKATVSWRDADATDDARRAAAAADETLIPAIIELVAAPRLAALAGAAWDPLVASQTANLVRAFEHVKEFDLPDSSCEVRRVWDGPTGVCYVLLAPAVARPLC